MFEPRSHPTLSTTSTPLNSAAFSHDQQRVIFTNFDEWPITIQKGTTLRHVSSLPASSTYTLWLEATEDLNALWGLRSVDLPPLIVTSEPGIASKTADARPRSPRASQEDPPTQVES